MELEEGKNNNAFIAPENETVSDIESTQDIATTFSTTVAPSALQLLLLEYWRQQNHRRQNNIDCGQEPTSGKTEYEQVMQTFDDC